MQRILPQRPASPASPRIEFYREEFLKHHRCLQAQRECECFSPQTLDGVEAALLRIIGDLDTLSATHDADLVIARLLKEFDVVTRLSAWSDPLRAH